MDKHRDELTRLKADYAMGGPPPFSLELDEQRAWAFEELFDCLKNAPYSGGVGVALKWAEFLVAKWAGEGFSLWRHQRLWDKSWTAPTFEVRAWLQAADAHLVPRGPERVWKVFPNAVYLLASIARESERVLADLVRDETERVERERVAHEKALKSLEELEAAREAMLEETRPIEPEIRFDATALEWLGVTRAHLDFGFDARSDVMRQLMGPARYASAVKMDPAFAAAWGGGLQGFSRGFPQSFSQSELVARTAWGATPLHYAARTLANTLRWCEMAEPATIEHEINALDAHGRTPLNYARSAEVRELLVGLGGRVRDD
jgi:hypothetical protein